MMSRVTLIGRDTERAAIERLESGALVVRGDPGIGKTALLDYAGEIATGRVLRTAGVEADIDLAFAGLFGLLRPLADRLGELPEAQAAALAGALGLAAADGADRFLVGVATL